ncbi:MAG: hypothetical protein RIS79_1960 [Verrucomicrobiota bacterium]|jgi:hypothetical protein
MLGEGGGAAGGRPLILYKKAVLSVSSAVSLGFAQDGPEVNVRSIRPGTFQIAVDANENGLTAAGLTNMPKGAKISVEISGDGFLKPSKWTGTTKRAYDIVASFPKSVRYDASLSQVSRPPVKKAVRRCFADPVKDFRREPC